MAKIINDEELKAAENEAAMVKDIGCYTHKFDPAFEFEGKSYESLTFNFAKLTGRDSLDIENEMQALGKPLIAPEFSGEYLIRMASKACTEKLGSDAIEALPLAAYNRIRNRARSFLLRSGS